MIPLVFPHWFDAAVPPAIVEEVGKKKKQPPPIPNVVLVSRSTPDGESRLKKAINLILKAAGHADKLLVLRKSHEENNRDICNAEFSMDNRIVQEYEPLNCPPYGDEDSVAKDAEDEE